MRRSSIVPFLLAAQFAGAQSRASIFARDAGAPLRLDANLRDSAWAFADSIAGITQREPVEGTPNSERTVVKVLRDADNFWLAVIAYDSDPAGIVATQFRRDADPDVDDNVGIAIDSYDQQRTAFGFATNPNGMMWDAQLTGTQDWDVNWNGIWYVAATRGAHGWTALFQIPFRTLRFHDGTNVTFGFNVRRFIRRKNEEDLWQSWLRNQGLENLQFEGEVVIAGSLVRGLDAEIRPNAILKSALPVYDSTGTQTYHGVTTGKVGMDAKLAVTPTMTADLTANADFAEVEADSQVVNLTRFPVYFPEKREFFLENADLFTFGATLRNYLFYSRRVGLDDSGNAVPILAGARIYGDAGKWSVGTLGAVTGGTDQAVDVVARVRRNVLERAYIGAIATVNTGPGVVGTASALGVDADFPLRVGGQNLEPKFWIAGTRVPGIPGTPVAWRAYLDYPNDIWDNFAAIYKVEAGFDPVLGFVQATGIRETNGHFNWMPRPQSTVIRNYDIQFLSWDIIAADTGAVGNAINWENANFDVRPFGIEFQSGDHIMFDVARLLDAPESTFVIFPGTAIPPGHYWWTTYTLAAQLAPGRVVSGSLALTGGGFYNGTQRTAAASVTWRGGGHVAVGADVSLSDVRIPFGDFTAEQTALRFEYDFSTKLTLLGFAQHTNTQNRADFQFRLHWIPRVGDDLFVVWSSGYSTWRFSPYRFPAWDAFPHELNATLAIKVAHRIPL